MTNNTEGNYAVHLYDDMHGLIVNYKADPECKDSNRELALRYRRALKNAVKLIGEFIESAKGAKPIYQHISLFVKPHQ